jgi:signal transduction histidine kinase
LLRDGLSIPLAALAVAIAITLFAWYTVTVFVNGLEQAHFDDEVLATVFSINNRMQEYEQVLFGAKGLFASSQQVERAEWKAFVDNQLIHQRFPGMQGIGFSERVPADKLASHIASVRSEEGLANYTVWPESQKQEYYPVVLAEPVDARNRSALGFDESSEQVRNTAISRAIDSGQTTITGKITLITVTENNTQSGFLMMVPVYENGLPADTPDERRENIKGLVFSPFRINDLMAGITGRTVRDVTFSIHDGGSPESQNLMFDLAAVAGTKEADIDRSLEKTVIMEIGSRQWILEFTALDSIHSGFNPFMPYIVLAVGLALSGVLFYVMYSTSRLRVETGELAWAAEEIARGNLDVRLDSKLLASQDRVGSLARIFDEMRKSVKAGTDDLKKMNEDLVRIDKMKEEFSSMVSHELKSPLTPIKFGADALLDPESSGNLTEDQKGHARMVVRNATKMENLINDLMDSYKLEIDKLTFVMTENDIGQMVSQCVADLAPYAKDKAIRLEADVKASGTITCDRKRIDQVLANLVKNSVDFVPESGGMIKVKVEDGGGRNDVAVFSVEDNGVGIPADKVDRLFEKFYQIDTTAKRKFGGSGLGLPISKGIVEAHGGKIWADQVYTGGAAIRFTLPRASLQRP